MAHFSSLWFAIRIWFLMEWNMAKRRFTPEQRAECWRLHGQRMDEIKAELEQKIAARGSSQEGR